MTIEKMPKKITLAYLILYAAGYSSADLVREISNIAASAPLDSDTYAEVYGALGLAA